MNHVAELTTTSVHFAGAVARSGLLTQGYFGEETMQQRSERCPSHQPQEIVVLEVVHNR
jgi:hypothetical protein